MPTTRVPWSNAAKTWNPLKFAGMPQTTGPISAASEQKFTILWGHVKEILLLNKFFPIVDMCLSCEDIARQSCVMVLKWRLFGNFFAPAFPASRAQHVSDLHSKLALGHTTCQSMVDIQSAAAEIRRGKKIERKKPQGKNIMSASATQGGHNKSQMLPVIR